jgi:hypothetical protein
MIDGFKINISVLLEVGASEFQMVNSLCCQFTSHSQSERLISYKVNAQ